MEKKDNIKSHNESQRKLTPAEETAKLFSQIPYWGGSLKRQSEHHEEMLRKKGLL